MTPPVLTVNPPPGMIDTGSASLPPPYNSRCNDPSYENVDEIACVDPGPRAVHLRCKWLERFGIDGQFCARDGY